MAEQTSWVYDPIYFDATVRRSGNSLVITVPPELTRRMLISEDQPVRIVGAVKIGMMLEGALLIHLGFFSCSERVTAIKCVFTHPSAKDEKLPFIEELIHRYAATDHEIKKVKEGIEVKIYLGSILKNGFRPRSGRELRMVMDELKRLAEAKGYTVNNLEIVEETVNLEGVDPSIVAQAQKHSPTKISYKWVI
ncbi:MAG: hypothetical protein QXN08_02835 [Nitrososphaerales archaeon]